MLNTLEKYCSRMRLMENCQRLSIQRSEQVASSCLIGDKKVTDKLGTVLSVFINRVCFDRRRLGFPLREILQRTAVSLKFLPITAAELVHVVPSPL